MNVPRLLWITLLAAVPMSGFGQTAEQELAAVREELRALRSDYEERIAALEIRLETLLSAEAAAFPPPRAPGVSPVAAVNAYNPGIGLILDAEWREFPGGAAGEAIPGFPFGEEAGVGAEGLSLGESELNLYANIDTRFYGGTTLAFVDEDGESAVEIEEAYVETLSLPAGLSVKAGRMFSSIGYLNIQHAHTDDFADRPLPYRAMLNNRYADDGIQLRWLAPTPLFFEIGTELMRGEGFPVAGAADSGRGATTMFAHVGGDVGFSHSWQAGLSRLSGEVQGRETANALFSGDTEVDIVDFVWKWAPNGNPTTRNFKLQAEYLRRNERGMLSTGGVLGNLDVDQSGWYLQGVYQFRPQWRIGARYSTLSADDPGSLFAGSVYDPGAGDPRHVSAMLDWSSSEFGRLRLQYNRDSTTGDANDQWLLQYLFSVGAHGAHRF
ncbi:MAG TPA: hypothetical protein VIV14_01490 [Gammaproteobacteria bacterium]